MFSIDCLFDFRGFHVSQAFRVRSAKVKYSMRVMNRFVALHMFTRYSYLTNMLETFQMIFLPKRRARTWPSQVRQNTLDNLIPNEQLCLQT